MSQTSPSKSEKNKEKEINSEQEEIQQLKTELKSAKNKLDKLANNTQKTHLENKLSEIENQIKNLSNPDKSAIKKLEREIKEIKQKIASGDKPDNGDKSPPYTPPPDKNQLQLTVKYYVELGQNHMWMVDNRDETILIDKENPIFTNNELTKKKNYYTITFLPQDAEKYHNQDGVYYFSKNNTKFTLEPKKSDSPGDKKEEKFFFAGDSSEKSGYCKFGSEGDNPIVLFYISKNHPRIKELINQGKLQLNKQFTIRYGKADEILGKGGFIFAFNEDNRELEITEI